MTIQKRIFDLIYQAKGISKQEISEQLHLSYPTVLNNVNKLVKEGYIHSIGLFNSTGGRKASKFVASDDLCYAMGIEIAIEYINFVMINMAGKILYHERIYEPFANEDIYYKKIAVLSENFIQETGTVPGNFVGCGIAIPATIEPSNHWLINSYPLQIKDETLLLFGKYIRHIPCLYVNDANAAAYAEFRDSKESAFQLYISLNDTVGGAVYFEKKFMHGLNNHAGEFGHICLIPYGKPCICGKLGCANSYCSAQSLAKEYNGRLDLFFDALQQNDMHAIDMWENYLENLCLFINKFAPAFDSPIVLGGYVGGYMDKYINALRQKLKQHLTYSEDIYSITACKIQRKAAAVGAALLQIDNYRERMFSLETEKNNVSD